jgi:5'-nucleotidase
MEPDQSAAVEYGALAPDAYMADAGGATDTPAVSGADTEYERQSIPLASYNAPAATSGRTHVVAKGETLFKLARMYYQDASRWKDIYQANQSTLADPNLIRVGQELVIP